MEEGTTIDLSEPCLDERPFVGARFRLYREKGRWFLGWAFKDGSTLKEEVVEKSWSGGRRFDEVGGSAHGEFVVIGADGNLELRHSDGVLSVARKR